MLSRRRHVQFYDRCGCDGWYAPSENADLTFVPCYMLALYMELSTFDFVHALMSGYSFSCYCSSINEVRLANYRTSTSSIYSPSFFLRIPYMIPERNPHFSVHPHLQTRMPSHARSGSVSLVSRSSESCILRTNRKNNMRWFTLGY